MAFLPIMGNAQAEEWATRNNGINLMAGAGIASIGTYYEKDPGTGFLYGASIALAKEAYDANNRGYVSAKDLTMSAVGAYFGANVAGLYILPEKNGFTVGFAKAF